jgi:hypothetical protein
MDMQTPAQAIDLMLDASDLVSARFLATAVSGRLEQQTDILAKNDRRATSLF